MERLLDAAGAGSGELPGDFGDLVAERVAAAVLPCADRAGPADWLPEPESLARPEPAESANAVGIEAMAAPTPSATAKPPTRPIQRA